MSVFEMCRRRGRFVLEFVSDSLRVWEPLATSPYAAPYPLNKYDKWLVCFKMLASLEGMAPIKLNSNRSRFSVDYRTRQCFNCPSLPKHQALPMFPYILATLLAAQGQPSELLEKLPPAVKEALKSRSEPAVERVVTVSEIVRSKEKKIIPTYVIVQPGGVCRRPVYAIRYIEVEEAVERIIPVQKTELVKKRWDGIDTIGYSTIEMLPALAGGSIADIQPRLKMGMIQQKMFDLGPNSSAFDEAKLTDEIDTKKRDALLESHWFEEKTDPMRREYQVFAYISIHNGTKPSQNIVIISFVIRYRRGGADTVPHADADPVIAKTIIQRATAQFDYPVTIISNPTPSGK